jgi:hypothetical protein
VDRHLHQGSLPVKGIHRGEDGGPPMDRKASLLAVASASKVVSMAQIPPSGLRVP